MEMGRKGGISTQDRSEGSLVAAVHDGGGAVRCCVAEWRRCPPGPDRFQVLFYKEFWALVKGDDMATLEELRSPQANMERINKSYLFVLPKRQGAENVNEYRSVSLSNSIYLIVAMVLANGLKEVIEELIGPFQYAFIPGRQLPDSVVMAGEILAA